MKHGNPYQKSVAQEKIENIETEITKNFKIKEDLNSLTNIADVKNKAVLSDESRVRREKLKGRFDLKINSKLPMELKINIFSNENAIFHLHKNRNFI
jgi:hypothetical protein